ncbi:MAG: zinc-binding alcohol dehydrogenase [Chloroflexi bacterium]|nr:zinc-binding alcohol dehydrogenase [Chloroflexota bacterium]
MRALYANNRGETYLKEVPESTLGESGVLMETIASVLGTGSEVGGVARARRSVAEGSDPGAVSERPMSYQSAGRIVAVTPDLESHFAPGDRVVAVGGGFAPHAERAFVIKHNFAKIPDTLDTAEAATANIGLTALHALRRAQFLPGETAAIIGLGLVGQMIVQMVRMTGGQAIGIDLIPSRLEKARELGVDLALAGDADELAAAVADHTCGLGVDASFVAAGGGPEPGRLGVRLVRHSGRVMMIGGLVPDFTPAHPDANPHTKEIDIRWVFGRGPGSRDQDYLNARTDYPNRFVQWDQERNLYALLRMQASGQVRVAPFLTHRFPFAEAPRAVDLLIDHPDEALAAVLDY